MMNQNETKPISVVIASIVGAPFIDDCLASVEKQVQDLDAEVIVVACGTEEYAQRLREKFPIARVVHRRQRETVPQLRRLGVEQACGEIIAIIEEHCLADSNWLSGALNAHARGNYGAVGGAIFDHAYSRLVDWVVYFIEYSGYLPPAPSGETWDLNGANIAYRRSVVLEHRERLGEGYWEASLHPVLFRQGVKFLSVPEMIVYHRGPFGYRYYLQQRYWFSRAFAGARAKTMQASRRIAYLFLAPLVPVLLLTRIGARVWSKRCHFDKFILALPLLLLALIVYAAGEWVGFLAGPGDALLKVE